jgi:hypothetical protein
MTSRGARAIRVVVRAMWIVALVAGAAACRSAPEATPAPAQTDTPLETPPPAPAPVDHLAPGELVEGSDQAFGLTLPRDLRVEAAFSDVVYASASAAVHPIVAYMRARLREGTLREGDASATFEHVKVPGKPGLELFVRVIRMPGTTRVEIRDTTPRPAPDLPDEAARWRQVGLTPEGRLLDSTHLD